MINSVCGVGSTGRICTDLYEELSKEGHECCIAYGRGEAPEQYNTYKIGGRVNNYIHVLETRLLDNHGFSSRNATRKLNRFIEAYNPDIIHLHNLHGYYLNISILFNYLKKKNIKIIWTLHDSWAYLGHSAYEHNGKECSSDYPKTFVMNLKKNKLRKNKILSNFKDLEIVTPSFWLANEAKNTFLNQYNITVIPNGIDLDKFKPSKTNKNFFNDNDKIKILGVANNWEKRKGLQFIKELSNKYFDKYEISIVGNCKENMLLNSKIKKITETSSVEELATIYTQADIFINPTLQDNFPTTNLEALACGTPVITFDTGGSPESIDPYSGIICKEKSVQGLNDAIEMVMNNKNITNLSCIKRASKFSKKICLEAYIRLYGGSDEG